MQIIREFNEIASEQRTAVIIGKFDGIHRGHRKLLELVLEQKKKGLRTVVFTFVPAPAVLFSGVQYPELTTLTEKRVIFEKMGIDLLVEFPMTFETAAMPAEEFVAGILCSRLKAAYVAAGTDLSFGDRGAGDHQLLKRMSSSCGYQVEIIDKILYQGEEISSTLVRENVQSGRMEQVTEMLGEPYTVSGTVLHGKKLGRTIGMPTVNLIPEQYKLLPPSGVYFSKVLARGEWYPAVTNIGSKPTVSRENVMGVESFLYGFDKEIYGEDITVSLLSFQRPEQKFAGVEELKAQMERDLAAAAVYHGYNGRY